MKVFEIARGTKSDFIIEQTGNTFEPKGIVFDSKESSFADYKEYMYCVVQAIEPDSDGGRKLLHLYI